MITTITIICLIIGLGISIYININQNNKISKYEEVVISQQEEIDALDITIEEVYNNINEAYNTIKTIDAKGSFEADDEVGFFFVVLKDLSEKLKGMFIIETTKKDNE